MEVFSFSENKVKKVICSIQMYNSGRILLQKKQLRP